MKISDFATVITGGTPSTRNKEYWEGGNVPWLPSGVCQDCEVWEAPSFITKAGLENSSAKMMPPETVLIALTGATAGKVGLLKFEACANQSVTGILPNEKSVPKYLFHFLKHRRPKTLWDCYGGAQPHISQGYVKNIEIDLPSLAEQKRIAAELDLITEMIRNREAQLASLDTLVKSKFDEMFGESQLNRNLTLADLSTRVKVAFVGTCAKYYTDSAHGVPMIRTTNITEQGLDLSEMKYVTREFHNKNKKSQLKNGDILIARFGSNGLSCVYRGGDANCLNAIIIEPDMNKVDPLFLSCLINSRFVQDQVSKKLVGSTFAILNTRGLAKLKVGMTPLAIQKEFAAVVEEVDKSKAAIKKTIENLKTLYKARLQEYFA